MILENPASHSDAAAVGQELRRLLNEPFELGDQSIRVGVSVGVALFPDDGEDADSLCRVADMRMYAVKRGIEGPEKRCGLSTPGELSVANQTEGRLQ